MMICRFCKEEIQPQAIKCKHCGEFLNRSRSDINANVKVDGGGGGWGLFWIIVGAIVVGGLLLALG